MKRGSESAKYPSGADDLTEFSWRVPSTGHRWIEAEPAFEDGRQPAKRFLIPEVRPGETHFSKYDPLQTHNALFRTFAQTGTSETGVLAFADKFGCLGGDVGVHVTVTMPDETNALSYGEGLQNWTHEILTMRKLITLCDLAQEPDLAKLRRFIRWKNDEGVIYDSHPDLRAGALPAPPDTRLWKLIASERFESEMFERFQTGDIVAPAVFCLQQLVNEKLAQHGVHARLLWDPRHAALALRMVPESLIGCLWLQFAKAIEGAKHYRQCDSCRAWFEIGGSRTARADKRFCSPSCKATAHRKKREEALRLFSKLVPVKEIARRLDTDLETVKGWVKK